VGTSPAAPPRIDPYFCTHPCSRGHESRPVAGLSALAKVETDNPVGSFKGPRAQSSSPRQALTPGQTWSVRRPATSVRGSRARQAAEDTHAVVFAAEDPIPLKIEAMRRFGADVKWLAPTSMREGTAGPTLEAWPRSSKMVGGIHCRGCGLSGSTRRIRASSMRSSYNSETAHFLGRMWARARELAPANRDIAVVAANEPAMKLSMEAGVSFQRTVKHDRGWHRSPRSDSGHVGAAAPMRDDIVAVEEATILLGVASRSHRDPRLMLEPAGAAGSRPSWPTRSASGPRIATLFSGRQPVARAAHQLQGSPSMKNFYTKRIRLTPARCSSQPMRWDCQASG